MSSLRLWVKREEEAEERKRRGLKISEREELERLRKENRTLREERDLLREAVAFFAKEWGRRR